MTSHVASSSQVVTGHYASVIAHAQTAEHIVVLASCLPVVKPHDIVQKCMEGIDQQK